MRVTSWPMRIAFRSIVAILFFLVGKESRATSWDLSQEALTEEDRLQRSVGAADAIVLVQTLETRRVTTAGFEHKAVLVRAHEVIVGRVPPDTFLVRLRSTVEHEWGNPPDPGPRLMFLVGSGEQWTLNDGPYEFAGGSRTLVGDDIARTRDRILRVVQGQSIDSLARAECIVLAQRLELGVECLVGGEERRCQRVAVERLLAGSCGADTLSVYSAVDDLPVGQSILFLRPRAPGVFSTASFLAGAIAIREGKSQRSGMPLALLIRQVEAAARAARR